MPQTPQEREQESNLLDFRVRSDFGGEHYRPGLLADMLT